MSFLKIAEERMSGLDEWTVDSEQSRRTGHSSTDCT